MSRSASPLPSEAIRRDEQVENAIEEAVPDEYDDDYYVDPPVSPTILLAREERKNVIKAGMVEVSDHDDLALFHEETQKFLKRLREDQQLKGYWKWEADGLYRKRLTKQAMKLHGQMTMSQKKCREGEANAPECIDRFVGTNRYVAPKRRIRITENIRPDDVLKIPIYSDIPGETLENIDLPDTVCYEYMERKRFDCVAEPLLEEATSVAEQEDKIIKCLCCSSLPLIPCYENEDCPCSKTNKTFERLQYESEARMRTHINSRGPMLIQSTSDITVKNIGFACSEACACQGKCSNNPFLIVEKNIIPFEIFRKDETIGFGIRSPIFIPGGTPVMEFVGEVIGEDRLTFETGQYAMDVIKDRRFRKFLHNHTEDWSDEEKDVLDDAWRARYVVDCKWQGNLARTAAHSCAANMEIIRVFQKGFTPAHQRLLFVPNADVFPGIPLTIDYGVPYMNVILKGNCFCSTFACVANPDIEKFESCSAFGILQCLRPIFEKNLEEYENDEKKIREMFSEAV